MQGAAESFTTGPQSLAYPTAKRAKVLPFPQMMPGTMFLAATAQAAVKLTRAVPVIVQSLPPEVIRRLPPQVTSSMPPVEITKGPSPDWVAWVTLGGVIVSAIIAAMTLKAVYRQIGIAIRELAAVKKDFALSQKQFLLNQRQFELSQKQFAEIMRRPNLRVRVQRFGDADAFHTFDDGSRPRIANLRFNVWNSGTTLSRDVLLEVYVPLEQLATVSARQDALGNFAGALGARNIRDDKAYARFAPKPVNGGSAVIYAGGGHEMLFEMSLLFLKDCANTTMLWRAFDQYGEYPIDGEGVFPELHLTK